MSSLLTGVSIVHGLALVYIPWRFGLNQNNDRSCETVTFQVNITMSVFFPLQRTYWGWWICFVYNKSGCQRRHHNETQLQPQRKALQDWNRQLRKRWHCSGEFFYWTDFISAVIGLWGVNKGIFNSLSLVNAHPVPCTITIILMIIKLCCVRCWLCPLLIFLSMQDFFVFGHYLLSSQMKNNTYLDC